MNLKLKILSFTAPLFALGAYALYIQQVLGGSARPNIASWGVWSFMAALNFSSYKAMSKDWAKSLVPMTNGCLAVVILGIALLGGNFQGLGRDEITVLIIGLVASLLWKYGSPTRANLMLQLGITVGFVSTFQSVWAHPDREVPIAWYLWAISYGLQGVVVIMRWTGKKSELVYPLNCCWLHLVVGLLAGPFARFTTM